MPKAMLLESYTAFGGNQNWKIHVCSGELSHVMEKCTRAAIQQKQSMEHLKKAAKITKNKSNLQKCYNQFPAIKVQSC